MLKAELGAYLEIQEEDRRDQASRHEHHGRHSIVTAASQGRNEPAPTSTRDGGTPFDLVALEQQLPTESPRISA
jgi:hypothetical protein